MYICLVISVAANSNRTSFKNLNQTLTPNFLSFFIPLLFLKNLIEKQKKIKDYNAKNI